MDAHKLQLKLYAEPKPGLSLESFIPVFHRWIKDRVLTDDTLVDVANYAHVPQGPGVVLIGHGADYFMEEGGGRLGLLFNRKRAEPPPGERLADAFRHTVHAALLLQREPMLGLKFRSDEWLFRINDRLLAPNTEATFAALRPELEAFCARIFEGATVELTSVGQPRQLLSVKIAVHPAPTLAAVLERVGGAVAG
jgi:hypothetical protein